MAADEEARLRVGQAVYQERARRGWSVETAMELGGVGHMTWRRIERGDAVQAKSYRAVDRAFGWPIGHTHVVAESGSDLGADLAGSGGDALPRPQQREGEGGETKSQLVEHLEQLSYLELKDLQQTVNHLVDRYNKRLNEIRELLRATPAPNYRQSDHPLEPEDLKKMSTETAGNYTEYLFAYSHHCNTMSDLSSRVMDLFTSPQNITTTELDDIHQQAKQTRTSISTIAKELDSIESMYKKSDPSEG